MSAEKRPWTQEELESGADMFSGRMMQTQNIVDTVVLPCGDKVRVLRAGIHLQCEHTALYAEVRSLRAQVEQKDADTAKLRANWTVSMSTVCDANTIWKERAEKAEAALATATQKAIQKALEAVTSIRWEYQTHPNAIAAIKALLPAEEG